MRFRDFKSKNAHEVLCLKVMYCQIIWQFIYSHHWWVTVFMNKYIPTSKLRRTGTAGAQAVQSRAGTFKYFTASWEWCSTSTIKRLRVHTCCVMSRNEFSLKYCKHILAETMHLLSILASIFLTNLFLQGHKQVKDTVSGSTSAPAVRY